MAEIKTVTIGKIKAGPESGLKKGQMIAYVSVFGNVDSYGDIVAKGAFANTLAEWRKSGRTIPLLYGHDMSNPHMNVGSVLSAEEDDRGLKILAEFDDDETAQKVYRLVKAGRLAELSFAFETVQQKILDPDTDKDLPAGAWRELQEVKLFECSVVPIGANPATEVVAVKGSLSMLERSAERAATDIKAGRTLSKANEESLREALEAVTAAKAKIETVLPSDAPEEDNEDDETKAAEVSSEERDAAPSADAAPIIGEEWTKALTAVVTEALETVLKAAGVTELPPPNAPEDAKADMLVTEIQLLELGPSE
ncbi:head maturation protease [Gordonia phage Trine]|uniref:Capsid maturation protease n=1 Tax=Gordonia phage Trine TaxID=2201431 RepID=A0A2Z4Q8U0_9CAUD|nr:head maturation protease [Gordonia phage Trine]AWY06506.1 capsid maturation protease [Gordonia phage Trine]